MGSYLLNASDADLARWKDAAVLRHLSFADFLRQAANTYAALPLSIAPSPPPVTTVALPATARPKRRRRKY